MDIFAALKTDHRKVLSLLNQLTSSSEEEIQERTDLLAKIKAELVAHNEAEEKVFYATLNNDHDERVHVYEGKDEHRLGGQVLEELEATDKGTEEWTARAKVLMDLVSHHIKEEEGEIHPQAQSELSADEAEELGEKFQIVKSEILPTIH